MKKQLLVPLGALVLLCAVACQKEEPYEVRELATDAAFTSTAAGVPISLSVFSYNDPLSPYLTGIGLPSKIVDSRKAALGRVLFYDKTLSKDGSISCGSCHQQAFAFGDNEPFSRGVGGQLGVRNTLALGNVPNFSAQYTPVEGRAQQLLWDGRAGSVVAQAPMAFTNPHEMGMTMAEVTERVRQASYYEYFFQKAYGDLDVTEARVLEALQEFVGAIGSSKSKLDLALEKVNGDFFGTTTQINVVTQTHVVDSIRTIVFNYYYGSTSTTFVTPVFGTDTVRIDTIVLPLMGFSDTELRGRNLFAAHCTKCHTPLRPAHEVFMACNGLEMNYADPGLGGITGRAEDMGVFKAPSLRNVAFTAPYMHDGRFKTLEEVLDFYSTEVKNHPNLHPLLRQPDGSTQINLTAQEKAQIIAFLKTMSADAIRTDQRFANPFY